MARINVVICAWRRVDVVDADGVSTQTLAFVPIPRYAAMSARQFALDAEYPIAPVEPRSRASHNHYFAAIHEGFLNLPEKFAARFLSTEHLRHWLLIETNWCREIEIDTTSPKEAIKLLEDIREQDQYARIRRVGSKVMIWRAMSQDQRSMGKENFEASKRDVLDLLSEIIGVPVRELNKAARHHA